MAFWSKWSLTEKLLALLGGAGLVTGGVVLYKHEKTNAAAAMQLSLVVGHTYEVVVTPATALSLAATQLALAQYGVVTGVAQDGASAVYSMTATTTAQVSASALAFGSGGSVRIIDRGTGYVLPVGQQMQQGGQTGGPGGFGRAGNAQSLTLDPNNLSQTVTMNGAGTFTALVPEGGYVTAIGSWTPTTAATGQLYDQIIAAGVAQGGYRGVAYQLTGDPVRITIAWSNPVGGGIQPMTSTISVNGG